MSACPDLVQRRAEVIPRGWRGHWPVWLFALSLAVGIYGRIVAGWQMPLWFDETFSGTIASQPNLWKALIWCCHELTGPGFYIPLWVWAKIFGTTDAALRIPSLLCSIATPLMIARYGGLDMRIRLFWAIFALLWAPALSTATEARPYAQLFLLGATQSIVFLSLMRTPTLPLAAAWTTVTALMGLTHYHALVIGVFEGAAFLAIHKRAALACWPALVAFTPLAAWMAVHLPFVLAFGSRYNSLYEPLGWSVRGDILLCGLAGATALGCVTARQWLTPMLRTIDGVDAAFILPLCGIAAIILEFALGVVHAGFMARYLTPSVPAVLFGCAVWVRRMERSDPILVAALFAAAAVPFALTFQNARANPTMDRRHLFNFESASGWIAERRPKRLIFQWSDGVAQISGNAQMAEVAGYFLHRAGIPTEVTVFHAGKSPVMSSWSVAGADQHAAVLAIGNDQNANAGQPLREFERQPSWECRDFGDAVTNVAACRHKN